MNIKERLKNKIKEREILKCCCIQKHTSLKEKKRFLNAISDYDKEIFTLCQLTMLDEYKLIDELLKKDVRK